MRVASHGWALAPVDATAGTEPVTQPARSAWIPQCHHILYAQAY